MWTCDADRAGARHAGSSDTSTRRVAADLHPAVLEIPPGNGSAVAVRVFDDHVRGDGNPFAFGELKAGPVDAGSDILFRVGPVGFVAAQGAGLRRFLRSEPLANFGRDAVILSIV